MSMYTYGTPRQHLYDEIKDFMENGGTIAELIGTVADYVEYDYKQEE